MKKGLSEIIAVVILVAIAVIGSVAAYYWLGGMFSKQPAPRIPTPLSAVPADAHAGYLYVILVNLGNQQIPVGSTLLVAENSAEAILSEPILPGNQQLIVFWGRYDKQDGYKGFEKQATIYELTTGSSSPPIALSTVEAHEATAYEVGSAEGFEPSMSTVEDNNNVLWIAFTSNQSIGSHDIWIMNSTDGMNWNTPYQIATQGILVQEDSPYLEYNGTFYVLYRSAYAGNKLRMTKSNNGQTWTTPAQTNVPWTDPDPNDYEYTPENKRGFSFIINDEGLFWLAYINGSSVVVRNSTDAVTWNPEITVNDSASPGKVSLMQDNSGTYWVAYVGADNTTIEVSSSGDAHSWSASAIVSDEDFGEACTGPAIIQDSNSNYFLFTDQSGSCTDMFVQASRDGVQWSRASWLPNATASDRHPSAMQDSQGVYRMAFADADSIHVRSSTDPMIWAST
ncbi:MAG: hypothetical protein JW834_04685 [Candidatus Diapherotrites archaeon]|nr:hypothetical protein [Candidatus Diapherotrites archaeon]